LSRNFVLIGNPIAGGGAIGMIRSAEAMLKNRGFAVETMLTSKRGDAESFARSVAQRPDTVVIAAGGDGTYNEVANGLVKSDTPLAILPLGTTSVLARELGIPLNTEKAVDIIIGGKTETVNMGKIIYGPFVENNKTGDKPHIERHFLLMAGIGIDADAVYGVNAKLKKFSGRAAYILSGLRVLLKYTAKPLEIEATIRDRDDVESGRFRAHPGYVTLDGNRLRTTGYVAIISKSSCYGGNFTIAPDAELKKPFLYAYILHKKEKTEFLRLLAAVMSGRALSHKNISYFRAEEITVNGASRMQIDGDYAGNAPARIEVVKNALKLVVPSE
jgi:diacylglycerol kinase (ATP)